jgi:hypothetical protein
MATAEIRIVHVHEVVLDEETRRLLNRIDRRQARIERQLAANHHEEEEHMGEMTPSSTGSTPRRPRRRPPWPLWRRTRSASSPTCRR